MTTHLVIPDTQAKPGAPTKHLEWIGRYVIDRKPDVVVHLGDHWDMPSLSSYDRKGGTKLEGTRVIADIAAGNEAFAILNAPLEAYNDERRERKERQWWPRRVLLRGNHEHRITRAVENDAQLDGLLSLDMLASPGWEVVPFLVPIDIDGVVYSHYFANPMNGRPMGGTAAARLKNLGHSFVQGHQQVYEQAVRYVRGRQQRGLIAGAGYLHEEDYLGHPDAHSYWRGVLVLHEVEGGAYNLMEVSLGYLCKRYEGISLDEWKAANL